jgi:hypothetical protein
MCKPSATTDRDRTTGRIGFTRPSDLLAFRNVRIKTLENPRG